MRKQPDFAYYEIIPSPDPAKGETEPIECFDGEGNRVVGHYPYDIVPKIHSIILVQGDSKSPMDGGPTVLTSPVFELAGAPADIELRYARWFTNDDQAGGIADEDRLLVEITDGSGWVVLETVDHDIAGEEWSEQVVTVSDHVSLTDQVQLRFTTSDSPNDSVTEAAVDAISIKGFRCGDTCRVDLDGDGDLTIFDFLEFQNLFSSGDLAADFDGDGELTIFDFLEFQNEFAAGCP